MTLPIDVALEEIEAEIKSCRLEAREDRRHGYTKAAQQNAYAAFEMENGYAIEQRDA